ncbi:RusA family crossover junction endodeoxyribonuclease [Burkholderia territorii]|uniref:RusA family crossover junction endodeoxyribonuclease n=1 Tax=Burkholderia territorii TaxID=1503055 RepID=UPI000752C21E|nr:RusA family crossover junction endodeoxyribonuclease [Burkholderia territorii]KWE25703.1 endodeoxyribonuclease RusA [Burkholderia territorii]KWE39202.1 endodeoxyribonuclease RusA [Burkholderia territorii]KWE52794.1 endodeoxyribonuclease RusA [Burkholderia territorii]
MLTVKLPYPISANRYWHPVRIGPRITIVPTKEAKAYKAEVAVLCRAAGMKPITGRVHVHIDLYPQRPQDWQKRMRQHGAAWDDTVRCLDVDNARKVVYDALNGVAFEDDGRIWSDSATRREPDGEARVVVTITPIVVAQPQAGLALELPVADPLEV